MKSRPYRVVLAFLVFGAGAVAQEPPRDPVAVRPPLLIPAGKYDVAQLARLVSRHGRCNILCDAEETERAKPIELSEPIAVEVASCIDTLSSLVFAVGYGLLPVDEDKRIYQVVSLNGPRAREFAEAAVVTTSEEVLAHPNSKRVVIVQVPLQHQSPSVITNALRPMVASTAGQLTIGSGVDRASLMVRGFQSQVAAILRLVHENDKPTPGASSPTLINRVTELEQEVAKLRAELAELRKSVAGK